MGCRAFSPGDLPDPGIESMSLRSPALAGGFFTTSTTWEAHLLLSAFFPSLLFSPPWYLVLFYFPLCALVSFLLNVNIISDFLCSLGQSTVLYFCQTLLTLLMGVYVLVHTSLL